jgi:hypothetical protein
MFRSDKYLPRYARITVQKRNVGLMQSPLFLSVLKETGTDQ